MKNHAKFAIAILLIGMIITAIWRFVEPMLADREQASTSDASGKKGTISIGIDGWVGYFPMCSPEMKKRLYQAGYGLKCVDDAADYNDRFKKLKKDEYQFAVATVDSYLLNGNAYDYPGPIVSVIDESRGGDAVIAWEDRIAALDDLKSNTDYKIAFTPDSPSHHLMKAIASHFDIASLRDRSRYVETDGSEAALKQLLNKHVDVAVVWEPDVTKALSNKGIVRLLGTEDTRQLIVDILIASQKTVKNNPDLVKILLKEYYRTLKYYREHEDELVKDIADNYSVSRTQANALLKGVQWATLIENVRNWYGISDSGFSDEALIMSIESAMDILLENKNFTSNPLPDEDPYRIVNSRFVQELNEYFVSNGGFTRPAASSTTTKASFTPLTNAQWDKLETIGSLKTRNIVFVSGTSDLTYDGKNQIDQQMADLVHYPNFRIEVRGHTGLRGDKVENLALSQQRADSVLRYIKITHGVEENRARAKGYGSSQPLPKIPGESSRRYNYRLPRVEIKLVRETI